MSQAITTYEYDQSGQQDAYARTILHPDKRVAKWCHITDCSNISSGWTGIPYETVYNCIDTDSRSKSHKRQATLIIASAAVFSVTDKGQPS